MKSLLTLLALAFAAGATAQDTTSDADLDAPSTTTAATISKSPSSSTSSPPSPSPTGPVTCSTFGGVTFLSYCCLGTYMQTDSQYQCIGEAIPLSASNFAALASSYKAGQIQTTTFSTNAAAMPTNAPGGLMWAGVGGAAVAVAYELV